MSPKLKTMTLVLLGLGLVWRAYVWTLGMPIWGDESFVAVNLVLRDFRGMFDPLVYGAIAPLGFMWAQLAVSRWLGMSEHALHLFPCIAGIAGLLLYHRFARRIVPPSAAFLAVGILAGSYFTVRHSVEVKPYATDLLIALVFIMLGYSVLRHPRCAQRWAMLVAFSAVAIWCSYPAMFMGGAVGLALSARLLRGGMGPRFLVGYIAFGSTLCVSAYLMYTRYAKPHAAQAADLFELGTWESTFPPLSDPWDLPRWFSHVHFGPMFAYPQGGQSPGSVATFLLFCVGGWRMWRKDRELFVLLLAPFLLTFIAAAMHKYPYGGSARVAQYVAPAICLLAGLGSSVLLRRFLRGRKLRIALVVCAVMLSIIPIGSMVRSTVKPYKSLNVRKSQDAVRTVAAQAEPGDRWIVFNADRPVPYAPYLGDWHGVGGQFVFDVLRFRPEAVTLIWSPPPVGVKPNPAGRTWLLVYYAQRDKVAFDDDQLAAYVAKVTARLGTPHEETLVIEQKSSKYEALKVHRFE